MTDDLLWKYLPTTQRVLEEVKKELEISKERLADGALMVSEALEREYCHMIGYLDGLKFIVSLIENVDNNEESDEHRAD